MGVPGPRLGAQDLPANPYDPEAAFAEVLAERQAELGNAGGSLRALEWSGTEIEAGADGEHLRALLRLRLAALTAETPLPEGFRGEFIARVAPGAMEADVRDGVPASVTIAQAILESGWGKSAPGHNLFGMKGEGPAGASAHVSVEYRKGKRLVRKTKFRLYTSVEESILDHSRVLSTGDRYAAARAVADDPAAYAKALQGRYASDPRYAQKLDALRAHHALDRFDWVGSPPDAVADAAEAAPPLD